MDIFPDFGHGKSPLKTKFKLKLNREVNSVFLGKAKSNDL